MIRGLSSLTLSASRLGVSVLGHDRASVSSLPDCRRKLSKTIGNNGELRTTLNGPQPGDWTDSDQIFVLHSVKGVKSSML